MKQSIRSVITMVILGAALTACGKDVRTTPGESTTLPQQPGPTNAAIQPTGGAVQPITTNPPTGTTPSLAKCPDPISRPTSKILDFKALDLIAGSFELKSFKAYQVLNVNAGSPNSIAAASAVEGSVTASGSIEVKSICQDTSQMPTSTYSWTGRFPEKFDAVKGEVASDLIVMETVHGAMDGSSGSINPRGVESSDDNLVCLLATPCSNATAYQLSDKEVAIIRETEENRNGSIMHVKTLSVYELKDEERRDGGNTGGDEGNGDDRDSKQDGKKGKGKGKSDNKDNKDDKNSKQDDKKSNGSNNGSNNGANNGSNNGANNGANKDNKDNKSNADNKDNKDDKNSKQDDRTSKQDDRSSKQSA